MDLIDYQQRAKETAIYPEHGTGNINALAYCALGLAGEAGEVANKVKKLLRDEDTMTARMAIVQELGDVLWYVALLADEMAVTLDAVASTNIEILKSRAKQNKIKGAGDDRQQLKFRQ